MRLYIQHICLIVLTVSLMGCAQLSEPLKVIWGNSTRALENARKNAIKKTYTCSLNECFDAILTLARDKNDSQSGLVLEKEAESDQLGQEQTPTQPGKKFDIFINNPNQKYLVVMGISGNVDTTEVGIFFDDIGKKTIQIEVSSLSSTAQRKVADAIFAELDKRFSSPVGTGLPADKAGLKPVPTS